MSVRSLLVFSSTLLLVIIFVLGGVFYLQQRTMGHLTLQIYDTAFMGVNYVHKAQTEFLRLEADLNSHQPVTLSATGRAQLTKIIDMVDVASEHSSSPKTHDEALAVRADINNLNDSRAEDLPSKLSQIDTAFNKLLQHSSNDGLAYRERGEDLLRTNTVILSLAVCFAALLAAAITFITVRKLLPPLKQSLAIANSIASGHLDNTIVAKGPREIVDLLRALAVMQEAIVTTMHQAEAQTMKQAEEYAAEQERRTQERQAEYERTRQETMHEISSSVLNQTSGLKISFQEIAQQAQKSADIVNQAVGVSEVTNGNMTSLSGAIEEIAGVAEIISKIAEQTNLLALNATIEAARAGESGKGFAVVANEVKLLAQKTAEATDRISREITHIQSKSSSVVEGVKNISKIILDINVFATTLAAATEEQIAATHDIDRTLNTLGTI